MPMMDASLSLLSDHGVQVYFLILGLAIHRCVKIYYLNPAPSSSTVKNSKKNDATKAPSIIPLLLSTLILLTTWFLILRFILSNIHTSTSYFDDAYKDVLRTTGHYFTSTQLLTWAIVAVVWNAAEGGDLCYLMFGFLGAMGAAFVVWVPQLYRGGGEGGRRRRNGSGSGSGNSSNERCDSIPITYAITSIIAFVSILQLQPCNTSINECTPDESFGTFHPHFRHWLQCLHLILIAPIFIPNFKFLPRIHCSLLFGTLAVGCSGWHVYQIMGMNGAASYTLPMTDCQISITTDLVCCSCITLYAIYKDSIRRQVQRRSVHGRDVDDDDGRIAALTKMSVAAIAMPLVSPAAVLAAHLCLCRLGDDYASLIAYMQQRVASKRRQKDGRPDEMDDEKPTNEWCNLGLWTSNDCDYNQACENLANALGKAANLDSSDAVLSCGCGSIDEVRHYKQQFGLRHITGIDPHLSEARTTDVDDHNVRTLRAGVEDLAFSKEEEPLFPPRIFDKILALDNIYHYPCKESFLRDCFAMLPGSGSGKVAVSDIVLRKSSTHTPFWVKVALRMMGVPMCNLWSVDQYRDKLALIGYDSDVTVQLVGEQVFNGWSFLPKCLLEHIDYALIVAKKPTMENEPKKKRKRVAIIGSGLAGLSTAHYLLSSQEAADIDVDIYEANNCVGLAGNTTLIGEQLVDVPARMACLGYYNQYQQLLEELEIPTIVVRTDSSFYGDDGNGSNVCYGYGQSSLVNIYNAVFVGGLGKLWQMVKALGKLRDVENDSSQEEKITFGEWLQRNLAVSKETTYTCKNTSVEKQHDLPSLTCHDNPFAYIMCGSLSWMLSCTWADLLSYPTDIVLPYCRGLQMDRLGAGRQGQVIRISPSIKVLESALLYGVRKLHLGSRVAAIDDTKVVNGVVYDAVIVATEAKAVPKVLVQCAEVFRKITYHPSTIYLHTDERFMPPNKKDWKCWNVEMSSGRKEPQLTFWLNEFYPDSQFHGNVFQTWAPVHSPDKEKMIGGRRDFERVVHSKDTREYIADINEEQGKNGIYYAGSYCVYGMGLLEQALISGKEASDKVLNDLGGRATPPSMKAPAPIKALVIGAGPSGLVAAKYLLESTEPTYHVTIVESSSDIGGSFTNKVYDNCRLVSSKYLTAFSDHRMPEDADLCPDHPGAAQYVSYLESYAERFGVRECIQFGCTVVSVKDANTDGMDKQGDSGGYEVQYKDPDDQIITGEYDVVAVCSGLHNTPYVPNMFIPSSSDAKNNIAKKFNGQIIHSSQYKDPSIFANKRVLILGCGETAMDIAHRAISNPRSKSVALSVRRGFLSIPHNLAKDRPLDVFITNLFEHAYEHPWVHALQLRWVLSTIFIRLFLFLTGSSFGFNQWAVQTTPVSRGYHIINKSHAAMSHLNVPIKSRSMWGRFWMWAYQEGGLRPIESFHRTQVTGVEDDGVTVRFGDGRTYEADLIVLATGYKQSFPFLDDKIRKEFREESLQAKDGHGCKGDTNSYNIEEDYLPSEHFIVDKTRPRLGFIGFVRPNVGAIPPMSELQVMWWLEKMQGRVNMLAKPGPPSYMILGRKYPYGVDYGNYMHRVAEDFDAAPTLSTLAKSSKPFRALYTYCIGQSMISLFRLQGRYESNTCWKVVTGELWRVCVKRGLAENCGLVFMTWLSLLMNVMACVLECLWCMLTLTRPKFFVRY